MNLLLGTKTTKEMKKHAEAIYPDECCGFFFGEDSGDRKITLVRKVNNSKKGNKRRRFEISPVDYIEAEKFALHHDLDLLGVYHSHPDHPAEPSEHDRSVALPHFSYIIISVYDGEANEIRSWQLNEERQFEEENIEITEFTKPNKSVTNHG